MKAIIASIAALGLVASPALAAPKAAPKTTTTSIAKEAKAEGESVKTEAKERTAAAHHRRHHATRHHKVMKKSTKTTAVTKKTMPAKTKG